MTRSVYDGSLASAVLGATLAGRVRRRLYAAGLLVAAAVLAGVPVAAAGEPSATQSAEDDGFTVESRSLDDYHGTQEDVQSNITDDLATKLRQFDEWTLDGEDRTAEEAAQQAAALAAGGGGGEGAGAGQTDAANPGAGAPDANTQPFDPGATANPTGATGGQSARPGAPRQPSPPIRPDRRAKEDDVAKMIREAAEQETDPERKQELIDQYEAYVDNL